MKRLTTLLVLLTAIPALPAHEGDNQAAESSSLTAKPWTPPPPPPDNFDWIQLKSGEWLKGRIKIIQDRKLEFDSEELDDQQFDIEDVIRIRTGTEVDTLFADRTLVAGRMELEEGKVSVVDIESGVEQLSHPISQLQGVAPAGNRERDHWSAKGSVGFNTRSGNTVSTDLVTSLELQRRTPGTRGRLTYTGNYSTVSDTESANNHRINGNFDLFLSPKVFVRPVQIEYFRDVFQNIDYRTSYSVSGGYYFFDRSDIEWQVSAGPGYQVTKFDQVDPGGDEKKESFTAVFSTNFEKELTKNLDFLFSYQGTLTEEAAGRFIHHTVGTLEIELTKALDFDLVLTWDRTENPQSAGATTPQKDDFRVDFLLGVDL